MNKLVSGSKNCQPRKKFSVFQFSRDLLSRTMRIWSVDPLARACTSRNSARITDTTRPDTGLELGRFFGQRHRFRRLSGPEHTCSAAADELPTRALVLVLRERGRF